MKESLDLEVNELSDKAERIVENLGDSAERLVRQLRTSIMKNAHEVSKKFGYDVKINFRKSAVERILIVKFDKTTAIALEAERSDARETIIAAVRRFNTNTGNGRLQINGESETVAFGFERVYRDVRFSTKKKFSENLDYNNGINIEKWRYLEIEVYPITLIDGRVIKYIVAGVHEI